MNVAIGRIMFCFLSWFRITFQGIHAHLDISVLMDLVFPGQIHAVKQLSAETELIRLLCAVNTNFIP